MPRDSSGNYTLPVGNPVIDGTVIDVNWANPTMNDIAVQLNNVITRDGLLGPTLPMYFVDGTPALPGIAFNAQHGTGIWRDSTQIGVSYAGVTKQTWGAAGTTVVGTVGLSDGSALSWGDGSVKIVGDSATDILTSFTAGAERMRIDAAGNVGIGVTPISALHVYRESTSVAVRVQNNITSDASVQTKTTLGDYSFGTGIGFALNRWSLRDNLAGVDRLRVSSTGSVDIGVPGGTGGQLTIYDNVADGPMLRLENRLQSGAVHRYGSLVFSPFRDIANPVYGAAVWAEGTTSAGYTADLCFASSSDLGSAAFPSAKMRITSEGQVLIGTNAKIWPGPDAGTTQIVSASNIPLVLRIGIQPAGNYWRVGPGGADFLVWNQANTGVVLPNGSTAWVASSDEDLKTNFVGFSDAVNKIMGLRAGTGEFTADEEHRRHPFLIAQDVQAVLPEAVYELADGSLGLAYTEVIPLLVAAIKELHQRIANLGG